MTAIDRIDRAFSAWWVGRLVPKLLVGALLAGLGMGTEVARAADGDPVSTMPGDGADFRTVRTAAATIGLDRVGRNVALPLVLGEEDVARYRAAFRLQAAGQFQAADKELARIKDGLLKGHVLAQRYLAPGVKPSGAELKEWMAAHADHPDAPTLYKMAAARLGKNAKGLKRPIEPGYLRGFSDGSGIEDEVGRWRVSERVSTKTLSPAERAQEKTLSTSFRRHLKTSKLKAAHDLLAGEKMRHLLDSVTYDEARLALANAYFIEAEDSKALELAQAAASRSGDQVPGAYWIAGLAAWRQGKIDVARRNFEALANSDGAAQSLVAAGAFWAGRANLAAKRFELVDYWFTIASSQPRTFYGILAQRMRGQTVRFEWDEAPFTDLDAQILTATGGGKRALGLIQVGQVDKAERELRKLYLTATPGVARALLAVASRTDMPGLSIRLGTLMSERDGRLHDGALYPLPEWTPEGGFAVDRALLFAFMRQESGFNPAAKSQAGARGLMQLMPATARFMGGKVDPQKLHEPAFNMALGQRYLAHLLKDDSVDGNIIMLAAAYNGGPGKAMKWERRSDHRDDPLLLLESIPSRETRAFIKRILANLWIYRARLGQPMPELDALAAGDWPIYKPLDGEATLVEARR
ncbi:MAG: lytic transglycosylase domain-containing protein [Rhodospirillales bacterium]|nr:lytic transglycosylase domain-containing protein [Rhodospirillales bacterium]